MSSVTDGQTDRQKATHMSKLCNDAQVGSKIMCGGSFMTELLDYERKWTIKGKNRVFFCNTYL